MFAEYAPIFLKATWVTLSLTAVALVFAGILGAGVAAMAMSRIAPLKWLAAGFIGLIRGTPLIAQLFLLYFGLSSIVVLDKFWAGAIALGVHNSAYIAEIIRSGFQSVPKGLVEAARSLGMSRERTLRRVQAPLAFRAILPVLGSQFIIAVKDSSLVAFIGLTELFRTAQNTAAATYKPLSTYAIVSVYYLAIVLVLTAVVNRMEKRLGRHKS
ncbi:amino acid ABC transporter permease [Tessaracoccus antarcticus]|uniref:Amino acid ABC transporter permease n=1 Tax=Tessaracoccus antarcticus TaxID=2479848 RepID=A0A3M0GBG7_9ACTN|nr:amino acid ABC transporter permease [Tessaracoccus antarcticus]RMB62381.1 amino acid ABC transporter permease [Tessaracoccus antarcticus]